MKLGGLVTAVLAKRLRHWRMEEDQEPESLAGRIYAEAMAEVATFTSPSAGAYATQQAQPVIPDAAPERRHG